MGDTEWADIARTGDFIPAALPENSNASLKERLFYDWWVFAPTAFNNLELKL